ncbi:hypothetical protein C0584_05635 [Candidatus Parcubacteria bacterium]|nr:MAG: hypothetical protein C0584_05635 [Candidatus Parcubacteria bacterium]
MEKIELSEDLFVQSMVSEIRQGSFTSIKLAAEIAENFKMPTPFEEIINQILCDFLFLKKVIYKDEAYEECRKTIGFEYLDYSVFNDVFTNLKKHAEAEIIFKTDEEDLEDEEVETRFLFWPSDLIWLNKIERDMGFLKAQIIGETTLLETDRLRLSLAKKNILDQLKCKKKLGKLRAETICRRELKLNFDEKSFEEGWLQLEKILL